MIALFLALLLVNPGRAEPEANALYQSCTTATPTALLPLNGAADVSPAAVPVVLIDTACGTGFVDLTLDAAGAEQARTVDATQTGLYWQDDWFLLPNQDYEAAATNNAGGAVGSAFRTGTGAVPEPEGAPFAAARGTELTHGEASVSLDLTAAEDPSGAGAPWELLRDDDVVRVSLGSQTVVDSFSGALNGQETCYTLRQYRGDGTVYAESDPACVTLSGTGCATAPGDAKRGATLATLALIAGLLCARRRE